MGIARGWLMRVGSRPKGSVGAALQGRGARRRAMDVDRICAMSGVGQEQNPAWTREKMRRRKFTADVELSEGEKEEAAAGAVMDEDHDGLLDVMA